MSGLSTILIGSTERLFRGVPWILIAAATHVVVWGACVASAGPVQQTAYVERWPDPNLVFRWRPDLEEERNRIDEPADGRYDHFDNGAIPNFSPAPEPDDVKPPATTKSPR